MARKNYIRGKAVQFRGNNKRKRKKRISFRSSTKFSHKPCCPLAKTQAIYKSEIPSISELTSADNLILYYLTRLKKLYSDAEWNAALKNPSPSIFSQTGLMCTTCENTKECGQDKCGQYCTGICRYATKNATIEELIAHSIKYGLKKGIVRKVGSAFKINKSMNSLNDLRAINTDLFYNILSKYPSNHLVSTIPDNACTMSSTSSSTLSDVPAKNSPYKNSKNRKMNAQSMESLLYSTSKETLSGYKPLRNHHKKHPSCFLEKIRGTKKGKYSKDIISGAGYSRRILNKFRDLFRRESNLPKKRNIGVNCPSIVSTDRSIVSQNNVDKCVDTSQSNFRTIWYKKAKKECTNNHNNNRSRTFRLKPKKRLNVKKKS